MHPKDTGREAFCRLKLAGIRALAPDAAVGLDGARMEHIDLDLRQSLLEVLEKLVMDLSHSERLAFAREVRTYRQWDEKRLRLTAERSNRLMLGGIGYEGFSRAVELAMAESEESIERRRIGEIFAKRLLELACFHLHRQPCLYSVETGPRPRSDAKDEKPSEPAAKPPALRLVR